MFELTVIVAVITGVTQAVKKLLPTPSNYMPLVSIALGIIAGVGLIDGSIQEQIFIGIALGLASSGAFDISKVSKKPKQPTPSEMKR